MQFPTVAILGRLFISLRVGRGTYRSAGQGYSGHDLMQQRLVFSAVPLDSPLGNNVGLQHIHTSFNNVRNANASQDFVSKGLTSQISIMQCATPFRIDSFQVSACHTERIKPVGSRGLMTKLDQLMTYIPVGPEAVGTWAPCQGGRGGKWQNHSSCLGPALSR